MDHLVPPREVKSSNWIRISSCHSREVSAGNVGGPSCEYLIRWAPGWGRGEDWQQKVYPIK